MSNELSQGQTPKELTVKDRGNRFMILLVGIVAVWSCSIKPSHTTHTFSQPITIHSAEELESLTAYFEYHEAFADSPFYELYGHEDTLSKAALRIYGQARLDSFFSQLGYDSKSDSFGGKVLYTKSINHE
jgi:hypothetical protein